jgi:hypothetical protein
LDRLFSVSNNLAGAWDNLTNRSHPMNLTFFNITTFSTFSAKDNYSSFITNLINDQIPSMGFKYPSILVLEDVWDYFPANPPINYKTDNTQGLISYIYVNGFKNASITEFENYDNEILINVMLHELTHTFIGYPRPIINNYYLFFGPHPASFRSGTDISSTYDISLSPVGTEGYYEIYSILNPARPYLESSQLSNRNPELSTLDKMLLGIYSPNLGGSYTFYSGSITFQGNKYVATSMDPELTINLSTIYPEAASSDSIWWDVRTNSSVTYLGKTTSFTVSKNNQNNRALWVFATDNSNPEHFKVFNLNSKSTKTTLLSISINTTKDTIAPVISNLVSIPLSPSAYSTSLKLIFNATIIDDNIDNVLIEFNGINHTANRNGNVYSFIVSNLAAGTYNYKWIANDTFGNQNVSLLQEYKINKAIGIVQLLLNGIGNNITIALNTSLNVSASSPYPSFSLYRNGVNVSNENNRFVQLPVGFYNYTFVYPGNQNYSGVAMTYFVNVTNIQIADQPLVFLLDLTKWNLNLTTNFSYYNKTQLSDLANVRFVNDFGEIRYLVNLNLNKSRNLTGLISIEQNRLYVNSSELPEFNRSAEIKFKNVSLTNPIIKVDGNDCPSSICRDVSFDLSNKEFTFNVSSFSTYEIVEMPVSPPVRRSSSSRSIGVPININKSTNVSIQNNNTNIIKINNQTLNNNTIILKHESNITNNSTNITINTPITGSAINSGKNIAARYLIISTFVFIILVVVTFILIRFYKKKKYNI